MGTNGMGSREIETPSIHFFTDIQKPELGISEFGLIVFNDFYLVTGVLDHIVRLTPPSHNVLEV